jgi:DNA-binding transcriptional ArsR family regulator
MQDSFFVSDLETMKALSDPRRLEILGLLQKPRTTRQVADVLGETANAMYYHMMELEKNKLIEVVKTAMKGHLQEKYYQAVARFYVPAPDLFESPFDPFKAASIQQLQVIFEVALRELHKVAADPHLEERLPEETCMIQTHLSLSAGNQTVFRERLQALVREFEKEQPGHNSQALLTVLFFPTVPDNGNISSK